MATKHADGTLLARRHLLDDGRLVTVRRAVPSDAPELTTALDVDVDSEAGLVALDDRGAIVGHVGVASGIAVAAGWSDSGLAALLADLNAPRRRHPRQA